MSLPPGQRRVEGFPRFGAGTGRPAPAVPLDPAIKIRGAVAASFAVPLAALATLPRREITADFHCVAGWSATNLQWEGVAFETFYRRFIEPALDPGTAVTHLVFGGLDGHRSVGCLGDALAEDVLIAENLDGHPLGGDHGAPARLVSPRQYGFISTKHLSRIDVHTAEPTDVYRSPAMRVLAPHSRARVWQEERHRYLPAWSLRHVYRLLIPPIRLLNARGSRPRRLG
ncbi:MAG: molybdopterin-dependent oxidoreductase [Geodermatophilaceae bacterium]|nr:molybdopterin-dependent oxidoreductase [Geodermatophilaceae bacterium]